MHTNNLCQGQLSLLFLLLSLREFLPISSGQGVTCVKPNSTATCSTEDHCQHCESLQYYFDNMDTTINQEKNVTMIFMDGSHTVNFSSTVVFSAQTINITVKSPSTTMTVMSVCWKDICKGGDLTFNSTYFSMKSFYMTVLVNEDQRYVRQMDTYAITITAMKVTLQECTFRSRFPDSYPSGVNHYWICNRRTAKRLRFL